MGKLFFITLKTNLILHWQQLKILIVSYTFFLIYRKTDEEQDGEGQNKPKKNFRKRHHKNTDVDLTESVCLKFRKFSSRIKLKGGATKQVKLFSKRVQTLPYEILQLEEVVSSANPLKIKLFTLSKEHLGYPSDLRSNFLFDHLTFFLRIHHSQLPDSANKTLGRGKIPWRLFHILMIIILIMENSSEYSGILQESVLIISSSPRFFTLAYSWLMKDYKRIFWNPVKFFSVKNLLANSTFCDSLELLKC